jgi:hypothetical protein
MFSEPDVNRLFKLPLMNGLNNFNKFGLYSKVMCVQDLRNILP